MDEGDENDSFERTDVAPTLQPQLRLYRRLLLSRHDLDEAKATVEELLARRIPLPRSDRPSALLMALTTALVVSYARPFVNSRGQSATAEKAIPGSLLRVLSSKEREMHDLLLQIRNQEIAHSNADILEIYLKLHQDGHTAILRVSRSPFLRKELHAIHCMIQKLEGEIKRRCAELRTVLQLGDWI